jgi:hypothetical protein
MVDGMTEPRNIRAIFMDGTAIDAALAKAAEAARHEALARGRPLIVRVDGQLVELWPDELASRAEPAERAPAAD